MKIKFLKLNNISSTKAFSLIEIVVSLAIFSFIFSIVIGISLSLVKAQSRVQSQIFLTQTAQTVLESMSRELRYGYIYEGTDFTTYTGSIRILNTIKVGGSTQCTVTQDINGIDVQTCTNTSSDVNVQNIRSSAENSPFILFESQRGDPTSYADQRSYCYQGNKLYKINSFDDSILSQAQGYVKRCDTGKSMLPENINLDSISFDIFGDSAENPKNPMVRIKMKLSDESGESVYVQTTVTQRLIQIL